jgi:membrane associated rhomboid family serine protease
MTYYRYRFSFGYGLTPVIKNLMIIMGAVFLLQKIIETSLPEVYHYHFIYYFALVPTLIWKKYFLWQLGTYIFLHGGVFHLLFNLLALWMFGGELENHLGSKKFLRYFLFCGISAGICTFLFTPYMYQRIPVIGASGAIYGLLLAFGWLFPNRLIYVYFLFPIPAKYFVIIFGLIEFFSSMEGPGGGVSHLTHLGGIVFGLLYMSYPVIRQKIRREYYKRKWSQRGPNDRNYYH